MRRSWRQWNSWISGGESGHCSKYFVSTITHLSDIRHHEFSALDGGGIFLNSASLGPLPARSVAILAACNRDRARPGLWPVERINTILGESRWLAARLINAAEDEIALMPNTTTGLNVAARALPLVTGDVVLTFDREFPANIYPWMRLADKGVHLERIPPTADGWPDEARLSNGSHGEDEVVSRES